MTSECLGAAHSLVKPQLLAHMCEGINVSSRAERHEVGGLLSSAQRHMAVMAPIPDNDKLVGTDLPFLHISLI